MKLPIESSHIPSAGIFVYLPIQVSIMENQIVFNDWVVTRDGYKAVKSIYLEMLPSLSVRSRNILRHIPGGLELSASFLIKLLTITKDEVYSLQNCGRKSAEEISLFLTTYRVSVNHALASFVESSERVEADDYNSSSDEDTIFNVQSLLPEIESLYRRYSVRSINAIRKLIMSCDMNVMRLYSHLSNPAFDYKSIKGIGRKSYPEVSEWIEAVKRRVQTIIQSDDASSTTADSEINGLSITFPDYIESYHPILLSQLKQYSPQTRNAIQQLLYKCGDSVARFYRFINTYVTSVSETSSVGMDSILGVIQALSSIKQQIEKYAKRSEEDIKDEIDDLNLSRLIDDIESRRRIMMVRKRLGYFPFFLAIQEIIDNMDERSRLIFDTAIRYKDRQEHVSLNNASKVLGLSRERVRQLREKLLKSVSHAAKGLGRLFPEKICKYDYSAKGIYHEINEKEGVSFSYAFTIWVLSLLYKEYTVINDKQIALALATDYDSTDYWVIVPTRLIKSVDFPKFLSFVEDRRNDKRVSDEIIPLSDIISQCQKRVLVDSEVNEIAETCKRILALRFGIIVENDTITLKANKSASLSDIAYDIVRENGVPMTLDEIYEKACERRPEKPFSKSTLSSAVLKASNVVSVGRSGIYSLVNWNKGASRGGTIRGFVCEYLDSLNKPIAPIEAVIKHVQKYRPTSSEKSIISNLMQESSHRFVILQKRGKRYLSYSDYSHGPTYIILSGENSSKRSRKESMSLLEAFILANHRFPQFKSEDMEEKRLCRFYYNSRLLLKNGQLTEDEAEAFQHFEEKYASLSAKDDKL